MLNLLRLPRNAIDLVCNYVDNSSLLQLREVCKEMREIADVLVVTKQTVISSLNVTEDLYKNEIYVEIFYDSIRHCILWKICVISVFNKLKIPKTRETLDKWTCRAFDYYLSTAQLKKFLAFLKPLVIKTTFCQLPSWISLKDLRSVNIETCTKFFDGYKVPSIQIIPRNPENIDCSQWLNLIRKCSIVKVYFHKLQHTPESFNFMLQLADIAKALSITMAPGNQTEKPVPLGLVQLILTRKCASLFIGRPKTAYSSEDVEQMMQFLHHTGMKKEFGSWVQTGQINKNEDQIGEFHIKLAPSNIRTTEFTIKHSSATFY